MWGRTAIGDLANPETMNDLMRLQLCATSSAERNVIDEALPTPPRCDLVTCALRLEPNVNLQWNPAHRGIFGKETTEAGAIRAPAQFQFHFLLSNANFIGRRVGKYHCSFAVDHPFTIIGSFVGLVSDYSLGHLLVFPGNMRTRFIACISYTRNFRDRICLANSANCLLCDYREPIAHARNKLNLSFSLFFFLSLSKYHDTSCMFGINLNVWLICKRHLALAPPRHLAVVKEK